ncbi:hypothetical protein [Alicyclobacillus fastidiosus]|uniref:Metallo-beta-lactamase domain-containing protein n=1 Tax=Alicyclobacillus fastidiosus TaxID=392011 RepID=A0ABV5ACL7_9BACL|nr:hypothetical protein [Alicyclobacillus fastidiosus]WEH11293.1 hypothetical protein PYS47_08785 [Alicyclobacillus fastidiosus]
MQKYICTTCGTQYPPSLEPPRACVICNDERQYVHPSGQSWTTLDDMRLTQTYENELLFEEEHLYSITTKPSFAIGQTAYVVQSAGFHLLWDCITYLDEATLTKVKSLGGLQAIALSHPHYYSAQVEWAEELDIPIFIHEDDRQWVVRPSDHIQFWSGEALPLAKSLTLHRIGGHFQGGTVLHWEDGSEEEGVLLTGDVIQVVADRNWVSFMYSYPNLIPLPANKVAEIAKRVSALKFDRLYNAFHRIVQDNANQAVQRSADRYIATLEGTLFDT